MNFFDNHEWYTLLFLALFPRLTLLIGSFVTGGFMWWLSFIICPHILVACLSFTYWSTNPLLVIIAVVWSGIASVFNIKIFSRK